MFMVMFDNRDNLLFTFRLYNMQGQIVREETTYKDKLVIYETGLESGAYLWTLSSDNGVSYTGKIIHY
jgi:hypothetical protein